MTLEPQVVPRGDSVPPYRARKSPEAIPVKLCGFDSGVLVLRCHDLGVAAAAIREAILDRALAPTILPTATGVPIWVRFVLDDYDNPAAGGVWERELRGTVGATPAVLYAREVPPCGCPHPRVAGCDHDKSPLQRLADRPLPPGSTVTYPIVRGDGS